MTAVRGSGVAQTKAARQQRIADLLGRERVRSQTQLADLLADDGIETTQATLSRDLVQLGAVRVRDDEGALVYAVAGEGGDRTPRAADQLNDVRLSKVASEVLVSAESSSNLVVLRTPPGAAHYLASALDHADVADLLGTIAGDDTVLLICRDPDGGPDLAAQLLALAEGTDADGSAASATASARAAGKQSPRPDHPTTQRNPR
ncbi:MAG TPA: arginine repressor [Actinomycetales bacterium]|nr:arginine repressor [Actinomycetales bacterium]